MEHPVKCESWSLPPGRPKTESESQRPIAQRAECDRTLKQGYCTLPASEPISTGLWVVSTLGENPSRRIRGTAPRGEALQALNPELREHLRAEFWSPVNPPEQVQHRGADPVGRCCHGLSVTALRRPLDVRYARRQGRNKVGNLALTWLVRSGK